VLFSYGLVNKERYLKISRGRIRFSTTTKITLIVHLLILWEFCIRQRLKTTIQKEDNDG